MNLLDAQFGNPLSQVEEILTDAQELSRKAKILEENSKHAVVAEINGTVPVNEFDHKSRERQKRALGCSNLQQTGFNSFNGE